MLNKTKETVLLYNIKPESAKKLKLILLKMGVKIKTIDHSLLNQPIGALLNKKDFELSYEKYVGEGFEDEMLIMNGFFSHRVDQLLNEIKKAGLPKINLKAIVTEHNIHWNSIELRDELMREHLKYKELEDSSNK